VAGLQQEELLEQTVDLLQMLQQTLLPLAVQGLVVGPVSLATQETAETAASMAAVAAVAAQVLTMLETLAQVEMAQMASLSLQLIFNFSPQ
jgi:hypothetical protein